MKSGILGGLLLAMLCGWPASLLARLNVVATLPDYGAIAREVGGDHVKVTTLARGTEDPHFVEPRPTFVRVLNQADLLVEGGADLETGWLPPLVNGARNAKIVGEGPGHLALARFVNLLDVPTGPIDRSMGDVHPSGNPHFNLDPKNGGRMADAMAEALARLDPAHAEEFRKNARDFNSRLTARIEQWTAKLAPWKGAKVVTYHRSFDYFLHRFGFELAGTIEPKPGIEPSPGHVNGLIPKMKQGGVKLILAEPNRPHGIPERLAEASGARLVRLPGQVGGTPAAADYLSFLDDNVRRVAEALKAAAP